jgi:hypothetical protein
LLGVFSDGSGFCANGSVPGEPCVGDLYSPDNTWIGEDDLCLIPGDPNGAEDRCISGTCTEVCKLQSQPGTTLNCFDGTCGQIQDIGIEEPGAICQ